MRYGQQNRNIKNECVLLNYLFVDVNEMICIMKVGDRVVHRLTGQKMTIKIMSAEVATLIKDVPEPFTLLGHTFDGYISICLLSNLIPEDNQLELYFS